MYVKKLLPSNVELYALSYYESAHAISIDDFKEDMRVLRKMNTLLKRGDIRAALNNVIITHNLFGAATGRLLFYFTAEMYYQKLLSLLKYLSVAPDYIEEFNIDMLYPDPDLEMILATI